MAPVPTAANPQPDEATAPQPASSGGAWSRSLLNFWIDAATLAAFLAVVWCSVIVRFVFPPAGSTVGWRLWGASYDDWVSVLFGSVAALALLVLVHVMLHWTWVCGMLTGRLLRKPGAALRRWDEGQRTLAGVAVMIVLLNLVGLVVAIAALTIRPPG